MKNIFLTLFAIALLLMPLRPYFLARESLGRLSGNEMDLVLALLLLLFFLYTILTQHKIILLKYTWLPWILSTILAIATFTTSFYSINYSEFFRLLIIIWLVLFIKFLLIEFKWKILTCLALGIIAIHAQWGISQFLIQSDLGLHLLGETRLSQINEGGIANFNFNKDTKLIRAYGPYAHANSLSGVLVIGILFSFILNNLHFKNSCTKNNHKNDSRHTEVLTKGSLPKINNHYFSMAHSIVFIVLLGIVTTFSRAALLAVFVCLLILFINRKLFLPSFFKNTLLLSAVIFIVFSFLLVQRSNDAHDTAIPERAASYVWSVDMLINQNRLRHTGPGQYTESLSLYLENKNISYHPWEITPVHSIPLLLIAEWGIVSTSFLILLSFFILAKHSIKKIRGFLLWLTPLVPLLLFDHYLLTQTAPLVWLLFLAMIYHHCLLNSREIDSKTQSYY